jgi:hypothetical protein
MRTLPPLPLPVRLRMRTRLPQVLRLLPIRTLRLHLSIRMP